jgi:hypothetical protein
MYEGANFGQQQVTVIEGVFFNVYNNRFRGVGAGYRLFGEKGNGSFAAVDRTVRVAFQDPDSTYFVLTDPAGRNVGNTAVLELKVSVGDINMRRSDGSADTMQVGGRAVKQA